ncbi:Tryptophan--tRNA ligase, mitochondrial, partial [Coemansia aciculifera]
LFYAVVDLHALTVPRDPRILRQETTEMAAAIIACGVDPKRSVLFRQSAVPAHTQLLWALSCITPVGWLNRMTQWKSKLQSQNEAASVNAQAAQGLLTGLLTYPVLMAADILLYRATHIPVGEDQVQHLEFARDLALHFNKTYRREMFPLPQSILTPSKRIMSLKDPLRKMSKSDPNEMSRITLSDSDDDIRRKIKRAATDTVPGVTFDPMERPGVANLLAIYAALKNVDDPAEIARSVESMNNSQLKELVSDAVVQTVGPVRDQMRRLLDDKAYLEQVLCDNEVRARSVAEESWREIAQLMGLVHC